MNGIIVDNFAGGGGASIGISLALGRSVDVAINHDPIAIAMHRVNHLGTKHYIENIWDVDPRQVVAEFGNRPVDLCWFSPDCKHFSKAKGGKPVEKNIRGLAWVAVRWAATVKPRVIILENVEEFKTWGPLLEGGKPDPRKKGRTFNSFVNALKRHGYKVGWRELRACDYGAPTIRKRLFLVARCDGQPIRWPEATHGDPESEAVKSGKLKPWRTAAEIIDWSLPCPSIFERKRPLAENTMRRIARGIFKFVIESPEPFIIKINHHGKEFRGQEVGKPLQTITAKNGWGIVNPIISRQFGNSIGHGIDDPLGTVTAGGGGKSQLVTVFLAKHYGGNYTGPGANLDGPMHTVTTVDHHALTTVFLHKYHGQKHPDETRGQTPDEPIRTLDTSNRYSLVTSHLIKFRGTCQHGAPVTEPAPTITAGGLHIGEVRAFLIKYYGVGTGQGLGEPIHTLTTKDRIGLVTVHDQDYQIADIGMRMLQPHELFAAQGFPAGYVIDRDDRGNKLTKAAQVALCGNSVSPLVAEALVRVNLPELCRGVV